MSGLPRKPVLISSIEQRADEEIVHRCTTALIEAGTALEISKLLGIVCPNPDRFPYLSLHELEPILASHQTLKVSSDGLKVGLMEWKHPPPLSPGKVGLLRDQTNLVRESPSTMISPAHFTAFTIPILSEILSSDFRPRLKPPPTLTPTVDNNNSSSNNNPNSNPPEITHITRHALLALQRAAEDAIVACV